MLASGAVRRLHTHGGCGCGDEGVEGYPYVFEAYVPAVARGALLRITDGVEEIWARRGSQKPPRAPKVEATVDRRGQLKIAWPEPSQEVTEAWLQWSDDKGATWHALATGLTEREATIDLAGVPAGAVQVEGAPTHGFDTAVSRPVSVKVPDRPTSVEILSPREGEMLVTGGVLRLWGSAVRQDGSPSEERPVRWLLDRREVGTGLDVWLDVPDPRTHRVELVVGESRARWSSDPSTPRRTSVPTPHGRSHGLTENHLRGAGSRCHKCEEVASRSTNAALSRCRSATLRLWGAGSQLHSWV